MTRAAQPLSLGTASYHPVGAKGKKSKLMFQLSSASNPQPFLGFVYGTNGVPMRHQPSQLTHHYGETSKPPPLTSPGPPPHFNRNRPMRLSGGSEFDLVDRSLELGV